MSVVPIAAQPPKPGRGGTRPGAGRPRKVILLRTSDGADRFTDPLDFLLAVMNSPDLPMAQRVRVALALMPYQHRRQGDITKRERQAAAADRAGEGTAWGDLLRVRPPPTDAIRPGREEREDAPDMADAAPGWGADLADNDPLPPRS